jgi:hypothetical protein
MFVHGDVVPPRLTGFLESSPLRDARYEMVPPGVAPILVHSRDSAAPNIFWPQSGGGLWPVAGHRMMASLSRATHSKVRTGGEREHSLKRLQAASDGCIPGKVVVALPGVVIFVTSIPFNLLSDGLRSAGGSAKDIQR